MGRVGARRVRVAVLGLAVMALVGAACGESGTSEARPLPSPTASPRHEILPDGRVRIWPTSARVEEGVPYRITVFTHCGLEHSLDFDGSFWDVTEQPALPELGGFEDEGEITLESRDAATYRSASGQVFRLARHEGPRAVYPCE